MKKLFSIIALIIVSITLVGCDQTTKITHTASEVMDAIEITFAQDDSANNVTDNLTLPVTSVLEPSANISWESSNVSVIDNFGTINRQEEDTDVTLVLSVSLGSSSVQKLFDLTVLGTTIYHNVIFDVNGELTDYEVVDGQLINEPNAIQLENYTFDGWTTNLDTLEPFDFDNPITEDVTIYAILDLITTGHFTIEVYIENLEDESYTLLDSISGIADIGTIKSTSSTMTGFVLNDELSTLSGEISSVSDLLIQSYFDRAEYTLTLMDDSEVIDTFTYKYQENINPVSDLEKTGYEFLGWTTNPDTLEPFNFDNSITEDVTIYAILVPIPTGNFTIEVYIESLEDESYTLLDSISGTTYIGTIKSTSSTMTGFALNDELSNLSGEVSIESDLLIQSYFDRVDYTLTLMDENGVIDIFTYKYQESVIPVSDLEKSGYEFLGWATSETGTNYYTFDGVMTSDVTLYAQFDLIVEYIGYYLGADGLTGLSLESFLRTVVTTGFVGISYGEARYILDDSDADPSNSNNVILVYRGTSVSGVWDGGITWNREHVWPQSLLGVSVSNSYIGVGSDLQNLKPANPSENSSRSNDYFDSTPSGDSYEPRDEVKGDIARILFYMTIRYDNLNLVNSTNPAVYQMAMLDTLLQWNVMDPVDGFEQHRNDVIYSYQHNRNPFIDHPEFVAKIWGTVTTSQEDSFYTSLTTDSYFIYEPYTLNEEFSTRSYIN